MLTPTRAIPLSDLTFTSLLISFYQPLRQIYFLSHFSNNTALPGNTVPTNLLPHTAFHTHWHRNNVAKPGEICKYSDSNDQLATQTKEKWEWYLILYFVKQETIHVLSLSSALFVECYYRNHYREHSTVLHSKSFQRVVAYSLLVIILILTHSSFSTEEHEGREEIWAFFPLQICSLLWVSKLQSIFTHQLFKNKTFLKEHHIHILFTKENWICYMCMHSGLFGFFLFVFLFVCLFCMCLQ